MALMTPYVVARTSFCIEPPALCPAACPFGCAGVTVEYTVQLVDVPQNVTVWSAFATMNDVSA